MRYPPSAFVIFCEIRQENKTLPTMGRDPGGQTNFSLTHAWRYTEHPVLEAFVSNLAELDITMELGRTSIEDEK